LLLQYVIFIFRGNCAISHQAAMSHNAVSAQMHACDNSWSSDCRDFNSMAVGFDDVGC